MIGFIATRLVQSVIVMLTVALIVSVYEAPGASVMLTGRVPCGVSPPITSSTWARAPESKEVNWSSPESQRNWPHKRRLPPKAAAAKKNPRQEKLDPRPRSTWPQLCR